MRPGTLRETGLPAGSVGPRGKSRSCPGSAPHARGTGLCSPCARAADSPPGRLARVAEVSEADLQQSRPGDGAGPARARDGAGLCARDRGRGRGLAAPAAMPSPWPACCTLLLCLGLCRARRNALLILGEFRGHLASPGCSAPRCQGSVLTAARLVAAPCPRPTLYVDPVVASAFDPHPWPDPAGLLPTPAAPIRGSSRAAGARLLSSAPTHWPVAQPVRPAGPRVQEPTALPHPAAAALGNPKFPRAQQLRRLPVWVAGR